MKDSKLTFEDLQLKGFEDIELKGFKDIELKEFNVELKKFSFMDTRSKNKLLKAIELLRNVKPTPLVSESLQLLEEIKTLEGIE
jgi:Fe-S-cluster formation regulator IscX/YfhJ